jgi:hypothetical protein
MPVLEQPMTVTLKAAEWLVLIGWIGGICPGPAGPAEEILHQLLMQLPEIRAALKDDSHSR